jgi:uncharacterized protein YbjQ (UPF0145 family)
MKDTQEFCKCGIPSLSDNQGDTCCSKCNRNVAEERLVKMKRSSIAASQVLHPIPMTTSPTLAGFDVKEVIGVVFGAGNATLTADTTAGRAQTAFDKTSTEIQIAAKLLDADGIVSIQIAGDGSGNMINRSQTVILLGTAVKMISKK